MDLKQQPKQAMRHRFARQAGVVILGTLVFSYAAQRAKLGLRHARVEDLSRVLRDPDPVLRVCKTIALEFTQPLTGALVYSELLLRHAGTADPGQRKELSGLREGVLQMERLIATLRDTLAANSSASDSTRVADEIEYAITRPRPRMLVPIS